VAELFATGRIVDLIAGFMLVEFGVMTVLRSSGRGGIQPAELAVSLAAGMGLLFALRAALKGLSWQYVATWLILALAAHVLYLKLRWSAK
jgi:hypothetical protein